MAYIWSSFAACFVKLRQNTSKYEKYNIVLMSYIVFIVTYSCSSLNYRSITKELGHLGVLGEINELRSKVD